MENVNTTNNPVPEITKEYPTYSLTMQGYQWVYFRRKLSTELVEPERGVKRNDFTKNVLVPVLNQIDMETREIRDSYLVKNPNGNPLTKENGELDYGDDEEKVRKLFEESLSHDMELIITPDRAENFILCRDLFVNTNQKLDEYETELFIEIKEKLNEITYD